MTDEHFIGRRRNPKLGIHGPRPGVALHGVVETPILPMLREYEPLEGALFERRRPGVDVVEIPLLGLPAGLPQDVGEGFLLLPVRPGGNQDDKETAGLRCPVFR